MADELLFDSERQEKKAQRRKWLFPALALAAVLLIAVVIGLILRGSKPVLHLLGEDTPYPFTWQMNSDGSVLMELPHENDPDYRWTLTNGDALNALEAAVEEQEKTHTTRCALTAREEGRNLLELTLLRQPEEAPAGTSAGEESGEKAGEKAAETARTPEDSLYHMSLLVEFTREDGELRGAVLSFSGVRRQAELLGGEDSANPYRIYARDGQRLTVAVKISPVETDWSCEILSGAESVVEEGVIYQNGQVLLQLRAGETAGESELVFSSEAAAAELRLRLTYTTEGALLATDHRAQFGEKAVVLPTQAPADTESEDRESREPQPNAADQSEEGAKHEDDGQTSQTEPQTEPETEP